MPSTVERSASLEVVIGSWKLILARVLPLRCRIWLYQSYVGGLSKTALDMYGGRVVQALWFSKLNSNAFGNTEKQVRAILKWLPSLSRYQGILREHIHSQRKQYGLKG